MKDFKKPRYTGAGRSDRPSFGGRSDFSSTRERFQATCSKCQKRCEVPFRPNGKKPVFCSECFVKDDSRSIDVSFSRRTPHDRPFRPSASPAFDTSAISDLKRQVETIHTKLDSLIRMVEASRAAALTSAVQSAIVPKSVKRPATKKKKS